MEMFLPRTVRAPLPSGGWRVSSALLAINREAGRVYLGRKVEGTSQL